MTNEEDADLEIPDFEEQECDICGRDLAFCDC